MSLIIFTGLIVLGIVDYNNYAYIIVEDNKNITKLISTNILSEINRELIKPIYVSLTMANDQFLKDWIIEGNEDDLEKIISYLKGIKDKYDYDSVFYVSNMTKNYYHYDKILKKINRNDPHDIWFYDFLEKNPEYDIDIDTDQAAEDQLTFFVNCSVKDDDGNLLGITGIGVKMVGIRQILFDYRKELNVEVFLIDSQGMVQIHDNEDYIENHNIFDDKNIAGIREDLSHEKNKLKIFELDHDYTQEYLTSQYIEELDLYLLVKKDTNVLREMIRSQIISKTIIFFLVLISIILINSQILNYFYNKLTKLASTDTLTDLYNRKMFDQYLVAAIRNAERNNDIFTLVLFDIDNLKPINDKYGHVVGDEAIKATADYIRGFIRKNDILARWGGDEFALIFRCDICNAKKIIKREIKTRTIEPLLVKYNVDTSIGLTEYKPGDSIKSIFKRADDALYNAKKEGKNKLFSK